ncbi:MAG: hypothetical protein OXB93_02790 [Cytophagales bacterium]|nr:hypothetical protein [Cytophagales bacterium]
MANKITENIRTKALAKTSYRIIRFPSGQKGWLIFVGCIASLCFFVTPYPQVAMWVAFALAGYSAIANDSIQTIGTFISSSRGIRWYYLWIFMGTVFLITVLYSWWFYDGDVSHQRLTAEGLNEPPTDFTFEQLIAPLILLILTRLRIPVSTSILLLSAFSTKASTLGAIITKSLFGYLLAFGLAYMVWTTVSRLLKKRKLKALKGKSKIVWRTLQWITSGLLWSTWLMQDASNIAVVLPRKLEPIQLLIFSLYLFFGLGLLFYLKGDRIQKIVQEKSNLTDIRAATLVDLSYTLILYVFKIYNHYPMSTTWVFIGLLGGRELAIAMNRKRRKRRLKKAFRMVSRDILYAAIGLSISLILALLINDSLREQAANLIPFLTEEAPSEKRS